MKYNSEDGTVYKSKKGYWITLYPMKENEPLTSYMIRIKRITDCEYVERNKLFVKNYLKNKYDNDENYRENKKASVLHRYHQCRSKRDERI